ncbi:trk system potassium uptake protein TrkH [Escherichia coli]|uniref:Trk system potassium uptake protein TrkH n=1 Tax=Escherichia coli TaxID=562 RepID=A0A2X3KKZ3_ECOLX|nr:trk system potassium uptake protein TrkH [Escherichia coli]
MTFLPLPQLLRHWNNLGPGLGVVADNFTSMNPVAKWILIANMLFGLSRSLHCWCSLPRLSGVNDGVIRENINLFSTRDGQTREIASYLLRN